MSAARSPLPRAVALAGALVALCLASAACEERGSVDPVADVKPVRVDFTVGGDEADWPFYPKFFISHRRPGGDWGAWTARSFDETGHFELELPAGCDVHILSEARPSPAMRSVFWMLDRKLVHPDHDGAATLELPPRTRVRLEAGAAPSGVDVVTLFDAATGTSAWALNDPSKALYTGFARGADTDTFQRRAENRPFTTGEFKPRRYVLGARVNGRQWLARRVELAPGGVLELDCGAQPAGGGRVICENGEALLLIGGELPVPMPYRRSDFRLRCVWDGVPPGRHAVRYPSGIDVPIDVVDGGTIDLPKQPAR